MAWTTPGTAVAGSVLSASFWNSNVRDNLNELAVLFTSPTSWTPTMSNTWSNGNATTEGRYYKVGSMVWFWGKITIGSTTTKGASPLSLSIPVAAQQYTDYRLFASTYNFLYEDTGANVFYGTGGDPVSNTATVIVPSVSTSNGTYTSLGFVTATAPFTWATGDNIVYSGFYQAAS